MGAFQWTVSPWFVRARQGAATWLIERDILWPLDDDAPWWLLTHRPDLGDVFSWLDGAAILAYIVAVALALGGTVLAGSFFAARAARADWRALALALVPLAGIGLFLGLSMMTATHLRSEGIALGWLPYVRAALLALGCTWSLWLGARLLAAAGAAWPRLLAALVAWLVPVGSVTATWICVFYVW